ncbi:hypothetical protein DSO57_1011598 [Entomophthora muscae]|uniref:Uncharacterized protein n=1 Tax=Entomophthora muscae TaxID=34485 RepID=A0ACC2UFX9_9FUNG|nr:hypothetical protein DSO57_1011598 [Entomophthora muscae]
MVPPVYWLGSEPLSELLGDLLGALIPQEGCKLNLYSFKSATRGISQELKQVKERLASLEAKVTAFTEDTIKMLETLEDKASCFSEI